MGGGFCPLPKGPGHIWLYTGWHSPTLSWYTVWGEGLLKLTVPAEGDGGSHVYGGIAQLWLTFISLTKTITQTNSWSLRHLSNVFCSCKKCFNRLGPGKRMAGGMKCPQESYFGYNNGRKNYLDTIKTETLTDHNFSSFFFLFYSLFFLQRYGGISKILGCKTVLNPVTCKYEHYRLDDPSKRCGVWSLHMDEPE